MTQSSENTNTHTLSHTHTPSLSHTHTHTLISLYDTHAFSDTRTHSLSHTHTLCLSLSLTHTHPGKSLWHTPFQRWSCRYFKKKTSIRIQNKNIRIKKKEIPNKKKSIRTNKNAFSSTHISAGVAVTKKNNDVGKKWGWVGNGGRGDIIQKKKSQCQSPKVSIKIGRDESCHIYIVCCSALQCVAVCCSVLQCVAVCCSVVQCVAVCCSALQCVAVCCSVLQYHNCTQRIWRM